MVPALYTTAALLALAWLALTLWALFADRSRGRARCPKCFFSLEGLSAPRCPECGRDITDTTHLHRTRRRWGVATLATVLILPPAALTAGLARVKQAGAWADVPSWAIARLPWLQDDSLEAELLRRVRDAEISRDALEHVALLAADDLGNERRRGWAYTFLEAVSKNSYGRRDQDQRPMLEELHADRTVPALLDRLAKGVPAEQARVLIILAHLRDADERANLAILASLASENQQVYEAAEIAISTNWRASTTVHRLPNPLRWLKSGGRAALTRSPAIRPAAQWIGRHIATCANEQVAVLDTAKRMFAESLWPPPPIGGETIARIAGLWLWSRLTPDDPALLSALEQAAAAHEPELRIAAVEILPGVGWCATAESVLRRALFDADGLVQSTASITIREFGRQAAPLVPDMLEYATLPVKGTNSDFSQYFVGAGGAPADLLAVLTARLEAERGWWPNDVRDARDIRLSYEFRWIADLGLQDSDAGEVVRWFVDRTLEHRPLDGHDDYWSILAYAVLTGDRAYATRAVLAASPDLADWGGAGSIEEVLIELCMRGLAQPEPLIDRYLRQGSREERIGFLKVLQFVSVERLAVYRASLEELSSDPEPTVASAARTQLDRLN